MNTKELTVPVGAQLLGRVLNAVGEPIDNLGPLLDAPRQSIYHSGPIVKDRAISNELLETGIKVIDLLAPIPRGGVINLIAPWGVGKMVLLIELTRNISVMRGGHMIIVGVEERPREWIDVMLEFRGSGMVEKVISVLVQIDDPPEKRQQAVLTGITIAEYFRDKGQEDLIFVVDQRVLTDQIVADLQHRAGITKEGSILLVLTGFPEETFNAEGAVSLNSPDEQILLSRALAEQGLYPAIDPLASTSRILKPEIVGETHVQVAQSVRELLQREQDLHKMGKIDVIDTLPVEDRPLIIRATRIRRFLTQPFFAAQLATAIPGEYVKVADTLKGCQALIQGQHDHLPEEAFYFVGAIEQAVEKAKLDRFESK